MSEEENLAIIVAFQGMQLAQLEKKFAELESRVGALESNLMRMAQGMDSNIKVLKDTILDLQKKIQAVAENRVLAAGTVVVAPGQDINEAMGAAINVGLSGSADSVN